MVQKWKGIKNPDKDRWEDGNMLEQRSGHTAMKTGSLTTTRLEVEKSGWW